jgi:LSD1 subclass zinc finger protein
MPVEVACPTCGVKLSIPDGFVSKKVRCASCSAVFEATVDGLPAQRGQSPPAIPSTEPPRRTRDWGDDDREPEDDEHNDHDEDWEARRMRRDLAPHRGGLILGMGIGSLVFGALGVGCCLFSSIGIPLGVASWIMGQGDLRKIDAGTMDPDGRGSTKGGYICGIIGCALGIVGLICFALSIFLNIGLGIMKNKGRF